MGRAENSSTRSRYAVAIPRKVVKPSGTPNSLITICPPAFLHALRVRRSSHERRVCARLGTGQDHLGWGGRSLGGRRQVHLDTLVPDKLHTGATVLSAAPIPPQHRCGTDDERMQEHADLARFLRGTTLPLALLAERTGTATADAGSVHHTQASIGALFAVPEHEAPGWLDNGGSRLVGG